MKTIFVWIPVLLSMWALSCSSGGGSDTNNNTPGDTNTPPVSFTLDAGYRINFGSNPRIMDYQDGELSLGYEYQAVELVDTPGERGYIAFSTDGLNFTGHRQFAPGENRGKGVLVDGTTWRRYAEDQETGTVRSESSVDGVNFVPDEGYRYDLNEHDGGRMGVRTFFVDKYGGVVLLYNNNTIVNGEEVILVKRAYSPPGDAGLNFTLTEDDVIGMTHDDGTMQSFPDPHAIVLPDGRVRLIVMQQDRNQPMPPSGRTGTIYSFISADGDLFAFEAELFAWDSFSEFEVRSLNDPKIVGFEDGSYHIYVAAMVPTETGEEDQGEYKWIIISATSLSE